MRTRTTAAVTAVLLLATLTACSSDTTPAHQAAASPTESMMSEAEADQLLEDLKQANEEADQLLDDIDATDSPADEPTDPDPTPTGPLTAFTYGTYLVGEDIAPGTYKTAGDTDGLCYWARSRDDSGELNSIIANHAAPGPARVTVHTGETFETTGCLEWTKTK
ncbi:hypothetical protein [Streptomyces sp. C10-9-1]|uniref:hypothetical protein n=1 Tax=Streptomyces sp. C10-9-1 TaxID=1859285 RepID=UPI003D7029F5